MNNFILGCDISKTDVHVCLLDATKDKIIGSRKFANTTNGAIDLMDWMHAKARGLESTVIMEATGVYHENLVDILYAHDIEVYVVNPSIIKHHIANHNRRYKNDKSDACMIAGFGLSIGHGLNKVDIKPWEPFSPFYQELRTYSRQILSLGKSVVQFKNRMEALKATDRTPKDVIDKLQEIIDTIEDTIESYKSKLKKVIEYDTCLSDKIAHITTIKGVGWLTAIHIICATDGFRTFNNARQLTAFAGLDIPDVQSGRCRHPGKISKCGNSTIRNVLYMPAVAAGCRAHEGSLNALYKRLYERNGGKGLKALVAVMRKMLCLIYTLWQTDCDYDPAHQWKPPVFKSDIQET